MSMSLELREHIDKLVETAKREAKTAEERRWQQWRKGLLRCWANDYRATMTAMLEGGPSEQAQK